MALPTNLEEQTYKRLKNFFEVWWAGAITLIPIILIILGTKSFYDIFSAVIGIFVYILIIIFIPIITSLFILKKIPDD